MIINVKVNPNKKEQSINEQEGCYIINLTSPAETSPAEDNKANIELIKMLAEHFNTNQMNIRIKHGKNSRKKLVEIVE
ncbi:DUF167 domain-containing protein [Candidatus Pacearchaeota archaeon]|nr:DUF167 domain-containing protein [Candidatus Pacearchaeota archaeon]